MSKTKTEQPILIYLLFVLFLGLKLTGNIDWSWWWITAPLWGYVAFTVLAGVVLGLIGAALIRREGRGESPGREP